MKRGENFPVASVLVRRDLRPAMHAFYEVARTGDDIADDPARVQRSKFAELARLEEGLNGVRTGAPCALALRELLGPRSDRARLLAHAVTLLGAFRQDVTKQSYADMDELRAYCRMSAEPVGRFVLDLHGEPASSAGPSDALCSALQILNHLQDMRADYARLGRVYLPQDRLAAEGATEADLSADRSSPALRQVRLEVVAECDSLLEEGGRLPAALNSRRLSGEVRAILVLARRLARRLRHEDPLVRRPRLSRLDFAAAALSGLAEIVRPGSRGGEASRTSDRA